jgi:TetR/AcrR family transcriptional regulator
MRILEAATSLFEIHGTQGTTIRQIAETASVNSQLIYYYFGDKAGLFRAMLQRAAERVGALLAHTKRTEGSPHDRLFSFVADWVRVTLAEASTIRILHRAFLEGDEKVTAEVQAYSCAHAKEIGALIAAGIDSGAFRADLDPRRAVASLVGMVQYLALAEPILMSPTGLSPGESEMMAKHTADLFLRGLMVTR